MGSFNLGLLPSLQGRALQTAIMLTSAMAFLLYGYDQGVLGGLLTTPEFLGGVKLSPTDSNLLGTVVAIYDIGCFVGSTLCAVSASKLGRRVWIGLGAVLLIIGAGLQGGAHNPGTMIAGRIIGGIGMGIQTAMIPVWVAECCQPQVRGTLVTGQLSIVIFGAVVAYWVDYGTIIHLQGQLVWRFPLSFQAAFCLLCLIGLPFLPESPRYLYSRGHNDDADQIIGRIYSVPQNHATVEKIRSDTLRALEYEKEATIRLKDVFWDRSNLNIAWRIWQGIIIMVLQQLGGPNLIGYYATLLYTHSLGMSEHQAALTSGGTFLVMWGGTLACVLFIERVGRRKLMIIGAISQLIAMALFTTGLGVGTTASQRLSIVCIFLYNFAFGASWCSIPFIYIPEILPLHGRAFGMALAVGVEWLMTFIIVKVGPIGIQNVGWKFYLLFVVGLTLQCFFSVLFIKETKGLPLEDIDALFQKKSASPMEKEYPSIPMKTSGLEEVEVV
jgi:sugar porter (SP) family MFS transporter